MCPPQACCCCDLYQGVKRESISPRLRTTRLPRVLLPTGAPRAEWTAVLVGLLALATIANIAWAVVMPGQCEEARDTYHDADTETRAFADDCYECAHTIYSCMRPTSLLACWRAPARWPRASLADPPPPPLRRPQHDQQHDP